jgi:hypothetical protein
MAKRNTRHRPEAAFPPETAEITERRVFFRCV